MTCDACDKRIHSPSYVIWEGESHADFNFCSISCVLEWAWFHAPPRGQQEEGQHKLSKSRQQV